MNIHPIKRCLSLLAALLLILSALPVRGLAEEIEEGATGEILLSEYPQELIVGSPTELRGDFFTEMFGNDTSDIDVRTLIHGYNLVNWDQSQGVYVFDPTVVTGIRVMQDAQGNRTYFLILADDLFYSDGTPITAWDYAFSLLLMMAPEMEEIGAKIFGPGRCGGALRPPAGGDHRGGLHALLLRDRPAAVRTLPDLRDRPGLPRV